MLLYKLNACFNGLLWVRLCRAEQNVARLERELKALSKEKEVSEQNLINMYRSLREIDQQRREALDRYAIQCGEMREIQEMACRDHLTNLLNHRGFEKAIHRQISLLQRFTIEHDMSFYSPYLILLDLDNFKAVNDTCGHKRGDEILLVVTEILNEVFGRDTDAVCRLGGDEFLIFLSENSTVKRAMARAEVLRQKIRNDKRLHLSDRCAVTASIGVTMIDIEQDTRPDEMDSLYRAAKIAVDGAMYQSKEAGKDAVTLFTRGSVSHE